MPRLIDVQEQNRTVAEELSAETVRDASHPYRGKQIAIVNGQVAVVADDVNDLVRQLQQMGASGEETLCFEGGVDYTEVHEIWNVC
jgi:hypothetical protein